MNKVALQFTNEFAGSLTAKNGSVKIGEGENTLNPYDMLLGALGSCLYATFLDIVKKMRLEFSGCTIEIQWEKRTETPTTLKEATIKAVISGAKSEKAERYHHAFDLATQYCSIFVTLSHVAELKWELALEQG